MVVPWSGWLRAQFVDRTPGVPDKKGKEQCQAAPAGYHLGPLLPTCCSGFCPFVSVFRQAKMLKDLWGSF